MPNHFWWGGCLVAAAAAGGCAGRQVAPSTYAVDRCPLPPDAVGYPVAARPPAGTLVDSAYLLAVVRSVTAQWMPNHERRLRPQSAIEAQAVLATPRQSVRVRGPWRPSAGERAEVRLVIRRDGSVGPAAFVTPSGRAAFDRSILSAISAAAAARDQRRVAHDTLPRTTPTGLHADSIAVTLTFGVEPREGDAVVRYAGSERPVRPRPGNAAPLYPTSERSSGREGDILVQFVVGVDGFIVPPTIRVLRTNGDEFVRAVMDVLPSYRFAAAEIDCRPIPQVVQMPFQFRLTGPAPGGVARP